ncbi:MAG: SDR family NAD(P)-dependent oxidoreductase [Flavisolibacter sp.]|jgi:short-subunit dehydrogenase
MKQNNKEGYALITGGTSGIGYEIAKCFAKDGYNLVLVARTVEGLKEISAELMNSFKVDVRTIQKDLIIPGSSKEIYEECKNNGLTINFLVNDAGQGYWGNFIDTDLHREMDLIHLNVIAVVSLTKYFLRDMTQRNNGKILQLASSLAKAPSPHMSVYAASKAFVWSFTEALIQELKDTNITMTALLPGATDTDFFHKAEAEDSKEYREISLYDPAEVAKAGYEGMMAGKDKVVPGAKNKMQGMMGAILPDKMVAANMGSHLKESTKDDGRDSITHARSAEERSRISNQSGKPDGDFENHSGHDHRE